MFLQSCCILKNSSFNSRFLREVRLRRSILPDLNNFKRNPTESEDSQKKVEKTQKYNPKIDEFFNFEKSKKPAKNFDEDSYDQDIPDYSLKYDKSSQNKKSNGDYRAFADFFDQNKFNDKKGSKNDSFGDDVFNFKFEGYSPKSTQKQKKNLPDKYNDRIEKNNHADSVKHISNNFMSDRKDTKFSDRDQRQKQNNDSERNYDESSSRFFNSSFDKNQSYKSQNNKDRKKSERGNNDKLYHEKNPFRNFEQNFSKKSAKDFNHWSDLNRSRDSGKDFDRKSSRNYEHEYSQQPQKDIDRRFDQNLSKKPGRNFDRGFDGNQSTHFGNDFARKQSRNFDRENDLGNREDFEYNFDRNQSRDFEKDSRRQNLRNSDFYDDNILEQRTEKREKERSRSKSLNKFDSFKTEYDENQTISENKFPNKNEQNLYSNEFSNISNSKKLTEKSDFKKNNENYDNFDEEIDSYSVDEKYHQKLQKFNEATKNEKKKTEKVSRTKPKTSEDIIDCPVKHPKKKFLDSINSGEPSFSIVVKDKKIEAQNSDISQFNLNKDILTFLKENNITEFSPIQSAVFSHIQNHRDAFICSETGSGKTLAYIIPLLTRIFSAKPLEKKTKKYTTKCNENVMGNEEREEFQHSSILNKGNDNQDPNEEFYNQIPDNYIYISNLILLPNTILVGQTMSIFESLRQHTNYRCCNLMSISDIMDKPSANFYVSTFDQFNDLVKYNKIDFVTLSTIVVDEADMMLLDHPRLFQFLRKLKDETSFQTVFSSSILPSIEILDRLCDLFSNLSFFKCNNHKLVSQKTYYFQKISQDEKVGFLLRCLKLFLKDNRRILIFVETVSTSVFVHKTLLEAGFDNVILSSMNQKKKHHLKEFGRSVRIAVCTDLYSRGVDIYVDTVINFDYPRDKPTFISRAGRTGRMFYKYRNKPMVLSFISKNWQLSEARTMQENAKNGFEIL